MLSFFSVEDITVFPGVNIITFKVLDVKFFEVTAVIFYIMSNNMKLS